MGNFLYEITCFDRSGGEHIFGGKSNNLLKNKVPGLKNRGPKENQATSVSSGPCPRRGVICDDFDLSDADRQQDEKKKENTQFITVYRFLSTLQNPQQE